VRFILLQHHQGQVTAERITAFLNSVGMVISKRRAVRLLTGGGAAFAAEMTDVLRAGLATVGVPAKPASRGGGALAHGR